ncbi:matrixin family metalloprotease [Daejeonella sp.]|jgi:archaemetzincin|uniref:matrixin family metalloprotease n=1 Tax=Daejeonella sp. TaxID=2805397 RepID=UPI0037C10A8E
MKSPKTFLLIPALFLALINFSCSQPVPKTIHIQPLGKVSPIYIQLVKESVKSFYGYNCVVKPQKAVTNAMLSPVKKRVDANKALRSNKTSENLLFITERDISHNNKEKADPEWGIMGLGLNPGRTAIISTFRLKKGVSQQKILERLEKVALHEIGHNLGLKHCTNNDRCMMTAAKGTVKQVDFMKVWLCEKCKQKLKK